jgi:uncharacterized protein YbaR (Trm112 family)
MTAPAPVTGFTFRTDCPECAGHVHVVNQSRDTGQLCASLKAVVACPNCRIVYMIETRMIRVDAARARDIMADRLADHWAARDLIPNESRPDRHARTAKARSTYLAGRTQEAS